MNRQNIKFLIGFGILFVFVWLISFILVYPLVSDNHYIIFDDWFLNVFLIILFFCPLFFIACGYFLYLFFEDFDKVQNDLIDYKKIYSDLYHKLDIIENAFNDPERHLTGMRKWYYYKHKLPSIICKHCFKSIVVKDITFTCPYCNHFYPSKEYSVSMESVLFDHCPHCGRPIKQLTCIHCDKDINLFEEYDPNKLINQEFKSN